MSQLRLLYLVLFLLLFVPSVRAEAPTPPDPQQKITEYTLPPERHEKAHALNRIYFRHRLINFGYSTLVLLLILYSRLGARFRSLAEKISRRRFVQTLIFTPLLVLTLSLFQLPADGYIHRVSTQYGLSIQSWPSWFWDWTKEQLLVVLAATVFVWLLYTIINWSPRRWWLYFWITSLPIALFVVFVYPVVIDPLFHKFEPLTQKDPELATRLSEVAKRAGEDIPTDRMFWMQAGDKTTTLNAYVTGFGASKRIVVWDTTMQKLTTPQIVFVAGHEIGHYVLQHVPKGLTLAAVSSLIAFYLGFCIAGWVAKWGSERWGFRGLNDLASLPLLILLLSLLSFASNPVSNWVSRYFEHQADQYALEITHGLSSDSAQVGAQTFQVMGYIGLSDPDPDSLNVFLFYSHPPIRDRVKFCLEYDPWAKGVSPVADR